MTMMVRKLRLQRGWTQEQLAELTGLSVRSIQRIEHGQACSVESQNSLAAVFEVERSVLDRVEPTTTDLASLSAEDLAVIKEIKGLRDFLSHVFLYVFVVVVAGIVFGFEHPLMLWGSIGWGVGIIGHGLAAREVLSIFDAEWETKEFEKRAGRSLRPTSPERGINPSVQIKVRGIAMKLSARISSVAALAGCALLAMTFYDATSVMYSLELQPYVDEAAVALVSISLGAFLVVFGLHSWRKARKPASAQVV